MRELIFGVFLGIWITILISLAERYRMTDYLLYIFIVVTVILIFIGLWRQILKAIAHFNPELWLKNNELTKPAQYDEAMEKRIAERKAKREAKKRE